jgi:haloacetate dehalogenase
VCWHKIAPALAEHFSLVIPDLRGYGDSIGPQGDAEHINYAKRTMARDLVEVMRALGHEQFFLAGHDRGGRVSYRLALDHPHAVRKLATLDIVPTYDAYTGWGPDRAIGSFHWPFLARPAPFPETMIGHDPVYFLEYLISSWAGTRDLTPFSEQAMQHYRHHFSKPSMIHATCEDYRAGATFDYLADKADLDAGRKIISPVLALWGEGRSSGSLTGPLETWRKWAERVEVRPLSCGHFLPEEAPQETAAALIAFFTA